MSGTKSDTPGQSIRTRRLPFQRMILLAITVGAIAFMASWRLALGGVVDREFLSPPIEGEPKAVGAPLVLDAGMLTDGRAWTLTAYESDEGLCFDVTFAGENRSSSGGCGFGVKGEPSVTGAAQVGHVVACSGGASLIFGPAAKGTTSVGFDFVNQPGVEVEVLKAQLLTVDYFVAEVSGCPEVEAVSVT